MNTPTRRGAGSAGFTLVECATACAVVGILAALTWPTFQGHRLRMARIDAVAALTRVQAEQEKHREQHGLYANQLSALNGVSAGSPQGRYTLSLSSTGAQSYRATARASGAQQQDRNCPVLTLDVNSGFPKQGPTAACWNH